MAKRTNRASVARCAECYSRINFRKMPELGLKVTCNECGTMLEVIDLDPLELDWADDFIYEQNYETFDEYEY